MNARLLVLASAAITSLAASAFAAGPNGTQPSNATAIATSAQNAAIVLNSAAPGLGSNSVSGITASGLLNLQQNTGANSALQSSNTLAAILDCNCEEGGSLKAEATSTQTALVLGDITVRTPHGATTGSVGHSSNVAQAISGKIGASSNSISGFSGGFGLHNISQNTGSNSVLQASNTVAEIRGSAEGPASTLRSN